MYIPKSGFCLYSAVPFYLNLSVLVIIYVHYYMCQAIKKFGLNYAVFLYFPVHSTKGMHMS